MTTPKLISASNHFVVIGPGFQIVVSSKLTYEEYCEYIKDKLTKNELLHFAPADDPTIFIEDNTASNTLYYRSSDNQITVFNVVTLKAFEKLQRDQQLAQARQNGSMPGSRIMRS